MGESGLPRDAINPALKKQVEQEVKALFPIETSDGSVRVVADEIEIRDADFDPSDLNAQQDAREQGHTRGADIYGKLHLVRDGNVVQRHTIKLGTLPLMNDLGTFSINGNDYYTPMAQLRLKPGAYTREKSNGEFETFIPMKGSAMKLWMDPSKGQFKIGHRSTNVDWYPVMRALGVDDAAMAKGLGGDKRAHDLVEQNKPANIESAVDKNVDKLYKSVFERKQNQHLVQSGAVADRSEASNMTTRDKVIALKAWLQDTELDPFVTRKTLGAGFDTVNTDMLLSSAKRILSVQRGDADPDDRDAPHFKTAHGVEDLISERIQRLKGMLHRDAVKVMQKPNSTLGQIFGRDWADPATVGYFGGMRGIEGGLAHTAEAANPLAILSERSKLTLTGQGGIQSDHAITLDARLFRPGATNFIDPVHTPEGGKIGVTTHSAANVVRDGKTLKAPFYRVRGGRADTEKSVLVSVEEASDAVVGYPEYWDMKTGKPVEKPVRAVRNDQIVSVDPSEVEYLIPSGASMFDHTSNAALFFAHTHANRGMMAGKHLTQALPLIDRENPLVDMKDTSGRDVLEALAKTFTIRSKVNGTVSEVTPKHIIIADVKHTLYDRYPMQAKVSLHHVPIVKVGDRVKKGQLIADSNYSKDGKLALGTNLRSAYMPWKNAGNFEDAIVLSESAAKKLTSDHMHRVHMDLDEGTEVNAKIFIAQFPTLMSKDNSDKLAEGIVKQGQEVHPGDILVAAVRKRKFDKDDRSATNLGKIHKSLERPYVDASLKWDEDFVGTVVRVVKTEDRIDVHIQTAEPVGIGDKLSMSSAAKGTVAQIVPDDQMPRDEKGRHIEAIFNPHGVGGRINPSQTIEQAAGKLVRDGGEKYEFANFDLTDHAREIEKRLKAKGLSHYETLFDPETGRHLERPVSTGYNYVVKLDHPVRKKFSARTRDGYTMDESPLQGKGKGGQSYDQLTTYALLGHNAHAILGESFGLKGSKNDDFWLAYQAGETPTPPKVPFVFEKFRAMLNAAGVDTKQHGNVLHFLPMSDQKVEELSNGAITSAHQIRAKDLAEERGGLFDPKVTGGLKGDKWAHIELGEKIPHPLYEKVVRDVTGMKQSEFYGLIAHTKHWDKRQKKFVDEPNKYTVTGQDAFKEMLSFDVDARLTEVKKRMSTAVGSDRNRMHRATRYLRGLKTSGQKPYDAYMSSKVPVIPPKYRGIVEQRKGGLQVAPANQLYRDLVMARNFIQAERDNKYLPAEDAGKARLALYDSYAALIGVGKSLTPSRRGDDTPGFVQVIKGKSNKTGLFQRQLSRRRNDYTGRSTIEPDANLGIDEIGIPEEMAWKIYEPITIRNLVQGGWKPAEASLQVKKRTLAARNALNHIMKNHPVVYNRAPSLHKHSVASAIAHITAGKELKISPAVVGPFNADFDGDTMAVHAPTTEAARREAFNLLPSKNLYYDRDRALAYGPEKDVIAGVFALTRSGRPSGKKFKSASDAIEAFENNKDGLYMNSIVEVKGITGRPTIGWLIFSTIVPDRFLVGIIPGQGQTAIDKKKLEKILSRIAKETPGEYAQIVRKLTQAGFSAAAGAGGITATVNELVMDRSKIKRLLAQFEKEINKGKDDKEKREIALSVYNKKIRPELHKALGEHFDKHEVGYRDIILSGSSSKANLDQFQQMLISPVLVSDVHDRVVPQVIKSSYGEGMRPSDYILTTPGSRAGLVARSLATALPGFLAKEIAGSMGPVRVSEKDCGDALGIEVKIDDKKVKSHDADNLDRHLATNVSGTSYKRGDVVTPAMLDTLRDKKGKTIRVRSPMTCKADSPPCQICAGRTPDGKVHQIGGNIGMTYGQAVSERSTQLTMKTFHSGGTVGSGDSLMAGFTRLRELLSAPSTVRNQGTLSDVSGQVTGKRLAPQGGHYVDVTDIRGKKHEHYIGSGRNVTVSIGKTVSVGDPLSDGSFRPQEIAQKKTMLDAQQYVVNEARKAYQDAGAVVRKPVLEVVAAGTMRYIEITDDGGEEGLAPGDVVYETLFNKMRQRNPRVKGKPTIPGLSKKPLVNSNDLLERLNFQRLEDSLREVPAAAGSSDLSGTFSPIPGLAYGTQFRLNEKRAEEEDTLPPDMFDWTL